MSDKSNGGNLNQPYSGQRRISALRLSLVLAVIFATSLVLWGMGRTPSPSPVLDAKPTAAASSEPLQFNRDIRPIFSDTCFKCHGFDAKHREAGLRLDVAAEAFKPRKNGPPIVPGHPEQSEAYRRLTSTDPSKQMPPPSSHLKLTPDQVKTVERWIKEGAQYQPHWAFIPPKDVTPPAVQDAKWVRNPVDNFILARLEKEGLKPSPEADPRTLLRRVTFDLTGLPPTPDEIAAFLNDKSPDAYEKIVDRLLASPHYGERMALEWLDAARYADSSGYQADPTRTMWPWRDWVVQSMNRNMPFNEFVVDQLAGDLLPDATPEQRLASGFNRNHPYNSEGGAIPEEVRVTNVLDRVDTTATTFLGLTVGCAKCHDHKFDPISQKEYYQLYAYFNQCTEDGRNHEDTGNVAPLMNYGSVAEEEKFASLRQAVTAAEAQLTAAIPQIDAGEDKWEAVVSAPVKWVVTAPVSAVSRNGATMTILPDASILAGGKSPVNDVHEVVLKTDMLGVTGLRFEALPDDSLPYKGPGRAPEDGNFVMNDVQCEAVSIADPRQTRKLEFAGADATYSQPGWDVVGAIDLDPASGWAVGSAPDKNNLSARFSFAQPIGFPGGTELRLKFHYESVRMYRTMGRFRLSLGAGSIIKPNVAAALAVPRAKRNAAQSKLIRQFYRTNVSPEFRRLDARVATAKNAANEMQRTIPQVMVMDDAKPRETHILTRGQYNKPADAVQPGILSALHPMPKGLPANRLALAQWIIDQNNPLTARVMVNRYWQMYFGIGIVKTPDDFGTQGEPPVHPELLDWMARQFATKGWNVKAMQRLIVTSSTYRQSSNVTPELLDRDSMNRLLSRGPRFRMPAAFLRDQALAASGLLVDKLGGPPTRPYQPAGVWEAMSFDKIKYQQDKGEGLYRRSLYTFWRRTVSPTEMFDVSPRMVCNVRALRTNTPLQALTLLNDVTYIETARVLSETLLKNPAWSDQQRLDDAFERFMARTPTDAERTILLASLDRLRGEFKADNDDATKLVTIGDKPRDSKIDTAELASWTALLNTVMNMDETITKE